MFENLKTDKSIKDEKDVIGGFKLLDSDIYNFKIMKAFLSESKSGAMAINLHCKSLEGVSFNPQVYMTSNKKNGCKNYYVKNGEKNYLPGFNVANAICLLAVKKQLSSLKAEPGVEEIYGETQKVHVLAELVSQDITFGVLKQIVDITVLNENTNKYEPTGKTKEQNEIGKVFRTHDSLTVPEIRAKMTEPIHMKKWIDAYKGEVINKAKGANTGAVNGAPKPDTPATGDNAPTEELFK